MNRNTRRKLTTTLAAALLLAVAGGTALARTSPVVIGTSTNGSQRSSYNVSVQGVSSTGAGTWMVPLMLDVPGAKNISVHGRVSSGSSMSCAAVSVSQFGQVLGQTSPVSFSATGAFQTKQLSLSSSAVPAGAFAQVACVMIGSGATLLGVDYNR